MQNQPRQALRETSQSEGCRSPMPAPKLPEAPTRRTHRTRPHPHGQASHARTAFAKRCRCASPKSGEPPAHEPPQQSDRKTPTQDACANTLLQYEAPVWCGRANPSKQPEQKDRGPAKRSGRGSFAAMLVGRFARAGKKGTRFSPPPHQEALQWFGRCSGPSFGLSRKRTRLTERKGATRGSVTPTSFTATVSVSPRPNEVPTRLQRGSNAVPTRFQRETHAGNGKETAKSAFSHRQA